MIGSIADPRYDDEEDSGGTAPRLDTRLRDQALHAVLRLLMLAKGSGAKGKTKRGGFISYAQLGINQLGAAYEGLMSYTGFIAAEELYEVAKGGDPKDGSWMIPASRADSYADEVFVMAKDENGFPTGERRRYLPGSFVYRLAGRDRQVSASYYTPQSLTSVTVELTLKQRIKEEGRHVSAAEVLRWRVCEPALGSGAFLDEAIDQLAALYLKLREEETGERLEPDERTLALQKVKAYIALHNCYGVDLNETAVELAEVSIWLNVMHRGLQAPWFGLHLVRGNSLIGAGRRLYPPEKLAKGQWLKSAPEDVPFSAGEIPVGHIHHFLLPAEGWGCVAGEKEARELAPEDTKRLADWRKGIRRSPSGKKSIQRLQALAGRTEYLWSLVIERLRISEREISRAIDVWGAEDLPRPQEAIPRDKVLADLRAPGTPFWRLKTVMDAWCALWFWPVDKTGSARRLRRGLRQGPGARAGHARAGTRRLELSRSPTSRHCCLTTTSPCSSRSPTAPRARRSPRKPQGHPPRPGRPEGSRRLAGLRRIRPRPPGHPPGLPRRRVPQPRRHHEVRGPARALDGHGFLPRASHPLSLASHGHRDRPGPRLLPLGTPLRPGLRRRRLRPPTRKPALGPSPLGRGADPRRARPLVRTRIRRLGRGEA